MKLKNMKTWEYGKFMMCHDDDRCPFYIEATEGSRFYYHNFREMLEAGWEAYVVPQEPLIKDEKIRKAVRAWAEACKLKYVVYKQSTNEYYDPDTRGKFAIKFTLKPIEVWLEDGKTYTIAELCGEEGPRPVIADGVEYDSYEDYLKSREEGE